MNTPAPSRAMVGINVTPLLDVVLVLLVVTMVSLGAAATLGVEVELPGAGATGPGPAPAALSLVITAAGEARLGGRPVTPAELEAAARGAVAAGTRRADLLADRGARHGDVVTAIDRLRRGGIVELAFGTEPAP